MFKVPKKIVKLFNAAAVADFACSSAVKQEMPVEYVLQFAKIRCDWNNKAWDAAKKQFPDIIGKRCRYDGMTELITIEDPESPDEGLDEKRTEN